jgi:ammonia channel protein AmtB
MFRYDRVGREQLQFLFYGYSWAFAGGNPFRGDSSLFFMRDLALGIDSGYAARVPHAAYIFFELQFAYVL